MINFWKDWYIDTIRSGESGDAGNVLQNIGIFLLIVLFVYVNVSVLLGL